MMLHHVNDDTPGLGRRKHGKGFRYVDPDGSTVRDGATLSRIRAVAIPPAWRDVWIAPDPDAHIQATGRDARGRKQYRYHTQWRVLRDEAKYHHLVDFCRALPAVRARVEQDLDCRCLCKRKVIATVVALMERAQLRVGNDEYARQNGSYGATTLRDRHAKLHGDTLELSYRAKGGIARHVRVTDRRLARIVRRCRELPGQRLFQYRDGDDVRPITSTDVNEYLHETTGGPFTAKDYRTWAATLGAALLLCRAEHPTSIAASKRCVRDVLARVAERLGHTPTVCRSSYVHPRLLDDFANDSLRGLALAVDRRLDASHVDGTAIDVDSLRAIEPLVVAHLASSPLRPRRRSHRPLPTLRRAARVAARRGVTPAVATSGDQKRSR